MHYTTLGEGKATKVIATIRHQPAEVITSAPHDAARAIARRLDACYRRLPSGLFDPAMAADGRPTEARRRLLEVFDSAANHPDDKPTDPVWQAADTLVSALAQATAGTSAGVRRTVREELGRLLAGCDGVLVPARAINGNYRKGKLDLCISGHLYDSEQWWTRDLPGTLVVLDDVDVFPLGGPVVTSDELYAVMSDLYDAEPAADMLPNLSMREIFDDSDDDNGLMPELFVRPGHLLTYVAHHHPDWAGPLTAELS